MSGLNSNTTYRIRVREICAVGDTSVWSNLGTFTTGCSNYIAPYTEDFEGSGWGPSTTWNVQGDIDQCWITQGAAQKFWTVGPPAFSWTQTGPSGDHTSGSGQYAFHQKTSTLATGIDPRLISPWIDLDTLSSPEQVSGTTGMVNKWVTWTYMFRNRVEHGRRFGIPVDSHIRPPQRHG